MTNTDNIMPMKDWDVMKGQNWELNQFGKQYNYKALLQNYIFY